MPRPVFDELLTRFSEGDRAATDQLLEMLYAELRQRAVAALGGERRDHTLQPTALVNEAYLRLIGHRVEWAGRSHLLAVAARDMRRILIEYARKRAAAKRGGRLVRVTLSGIVDDDGLDQFEVAALREALEKLAACNLRHARTIDLKYFGGLNDDEIAKELEISPRTVRNDLRVARAWLRRELNPDS